MTGVIRSMPGVARRQWAVLTVSLLIPAGLVLGLGHRGNHMARNLLVPGAGLFEASPLAAAAFVAGAAAASIAWVRWGMDWLLAAVVVSSVVVTGALADAGHDAAPILDAHRAAHEFPLVLIVMSALAWAGSVLGSAPLVRRWRARRARSLGGLAGVAGLPVVDRSRAVAVAALTGSPSCGWGALRAAIERPDVARRARCIALVARVRRGEVALATDHAGTRAAWALCGRLAPDDVAALAADAARRPAGVPASEPGWVRPLDATLAAIALCRLGHRDAGTRWAAMLRGPLGLRRHRRPAWYWTPLGIPAGAAPAWEHAATTALARWMGWVGDEDWTALRRRVLGAAARGTADPADARLVAAARLWLVFVDDPEAARFVHRRSMSDDPLAGALDELAATVAARDRHTVPSAPGSGQRIPVSPPSSPRSVRGHPFTERLLPGRS